MSSSKYPTWTCGGQLLVIDPCYEKRDGVPRPAVAGDWRFQVIYNKSGDTTGLSTWAATGANRHTGTWTLDNEVGVDSGRCGVFDDASYPQDDSHVYSDITSIYRAACDAATWSGVVVWSDEPIGVVSRTSWCGGTYPVYIRMDEAGLVDAVHIDYEPDPSDDEGEPDTDEVEPGELGVGTDSQTDSAA